MGISVKLEGKEFEKFLDKLGLAESGTLKVGFLEGAIYPDGTSVAEVAYYNEYGTTSKSGKEHVPAVPFMRNTVKKRQAEWADKLAKALVYNDYDIPKSMKQMGAVIKGDLQTQIAQTKSPENDPKTIKIKGFNKRLEHTKHMKNSVDWEWL